MNLNFLKSLKGVLTYLTVLIIIIFLGFYIYHSFNSLDIWGFKVQKSQIDLVRIDTPNHAFEIHNPNLVLKIAKDASHMKKETKITPFNTQPLSNLYKPLISFVIVTKSYGSIGGHFWTSGNDSTVWLDANGYYWSVPKNLITDLEKKIKSKSTSKLF